MAEMKLALGDIIMQCRLIHNKIGLKMIYVPNHQYKHDIDRHIVAICYYASLIIGGPTSTDLMKNVEWILDNVKRICEWYNWNFDEVSHLGFLHVMERFEQFEKEGWE